MALFPLKRIAQVAENRQTYLRGIQLYNAGRTKDLTASANAFYGEYLTAEVAGDKQERFFVELGFDGTGDLTHYTCTCDGFRFGQGACRHIVCALTDKYYRDVLGVMTPASTLTHAPLRTHAAAKRLMGTYLRKDVDTLSRAGEDLVLSPTVSVVGRRAVISLTVGREKPYVIKDLTAFMNAVERQDTVTYGKNLTFCHRPDAFTPQSRKLLMLVKGELCSPLGQQMTAGRDLPLSDSALDRFFELYEGQTVDCKIGNDKALCRFVKGDPSLQMQVFSEKGGFRFVTDRAIPLSGVKRLYLLQGNTLFGCSSEFTATAGDWLLAAHGEPEGLTVATEDMPRFYSDVVSVVEQYIPLADKTLLSDFAVTPPTVRIYLDHPAADTVTAGVQFCYEENTYPLFSLPRPGDKRDLRTERRIQKLMETFFTGFLPETGEVVFHGEDEMLYRFLTEGLPLLEQTAQVFATDEFKKMRLAPTPKIGVGVQVSGDLLELDIDLSEFDKKELADLLAGLKEHRPFTRLRSGRFVSLDDETLQGLAMLSEEMGLTPGELKSGKVTLPRYRALQIASLMASRPKVSFRQDRVFRQLADTVRDAIRQPYSVPPGLETVLRPYQKEGFRWLKTLDDAGFGGILADDMGLGKTVQMIALIAADTEKKPSLVVCPTSLMVNWQKEFAKFAPEIPTLTVMGDAVTRERLLCDISGYRVLITSYDLLKRDVELYQKYSFRYHILDEAQYIKNQRTQNAKAVKAVQSERRFALTGTPIENKLSELWSIFDFLMPGFLHSYAHFKQQFEIPAVREEDKTVLARLSAIVSPFLLRRLKGEVLTELPPKTEQVLLSTMGEEQRKLYAAFALKAKERIRQEMAAGTFEQRKLSVLTLLMRLRQVCCDPSLCTEDTVIDSCKKEACMELLKTATAAGHRVLLFSQFTSMLEILEKELKKEGISFMTLTGKTPSATRAQMVEDFNNGDCNVFLISLKAGGTGLNLTGADLVIHYDPWWNVAAQNQATDRAHRIGQVNPVQVIRLCVQDTVEQRILELQEKKQQLADAVLENGAKGLTALSAEELLALI